MPSSTPSFISDIIEKIQKVNPKSILDIGCGFGKWGFLCREYLETWNDRCYPNMWKVKIDAVEAWVRYVDGFPWLRDIYNDIYNQDVYDVVDDLQHYDVIIAGDVIEHLEKEKANEVLRKLYNKAKKCFILSIPVGPEWLGNCTPDNNPFEAHKSAWKEVELLEIGKCERKRCPGVRGGIVLAVYNKEEG